MAKKAQTTKTTTPDLLTQIVDATRNGGFLYVDPAAVADYVANGLVLTNPQLTEGDKIAAKATDAAMAPTATATTTESKPVDNTTAPASTNFVTKSVAADVFNVKRSVGGRTGIYPFDDLKAPGDNGSVDAFFVPASDKHPEPHKSLSSTVSAASRRFSRVVGTEEYQDKDGNTKTREKREYDRQFKIVPGEDNGVKGAWIGRTK